MPPRKRIRTFGLTPGDHLAERYRVTALLGRGWEGEVYAVEEIRTRVRRAAKLFFPNRNVRDRAARVNARKLDRLRDCPIVVKYHHSEAVQLRGRAVTVLVSELVEGRLLNRFIRDQPGKRLQAFEALHLLHALARGLEPVHDLGEYHGDVHAANVLVRRRGIHFDVKLIDLHDRGRATPAEMRADVVDLIHVLHEAVGGRARYAAQPQVVKDICRGLRRDLIGRRFPRAGKLRRHLEQFRWED